MIDKTTNIIKAFVGKLPAKTQTTPFEQVSFANKKILKHQEDKLEKQIILSGLTLFYRRPYELLHTYTEVFNQQIYKFKASAQTPLIIDCGSNIGVSVLYFKALYPEATVIAFEPDGQNFALLEKNVTANKLQNVTLNNAAVWVHNNEISFSSSGSEASHISNVIDSKTASIAAFRLNDLLEQHNGIDFLKIDIEGAEDAVLADCAKNLEKVNHLFLEYHGRITEAKKLNEIFSIITSAGFSLYVQNAANNLAQPFFTKTTGSLWDVQLNIFCFR